MSDYMFMLESHLNVDQNRVVAEVQAEASEANVSLFLTGGAMRDILGGFPVRDLDFAVEGNALKLAKSVAAAPGVKVISIDDHRRSAELAFPGGVTAEIAMCRTERYGKAGSRPQVAPATIQEDLRRRDFTVNAIALSLNRASKGLLVDPMNGLSELGRREIRTLHGGSFFDDPVRVLRLHRLRIRLGYEIEERTQSQYANAREARVEERIGGRALGEELVRIAAEPNPFEVLRVLEQEGLLRLFSPALAGAKLNVAGFAKFDKARRLLPHDLLAPGMAWGPFFHVLVEKLSPKERSALVKTCEIRKAALDVWKNLPAKAKKLENTLKSAKLKKPSQIYDVVLEADPSEILYLLYQSGQRLVLDRLKNYFQKYLPLAQEITDLEVVAAGVPVGSPKYAKTKAEMIAARVDGKTRKPVPPPVETPPPSTHPMRGRRAAARI